MVTEITLDDMKPGAMPPDDDMHVVMFYGATCGPCKVTMPNYEEAARFFIEKGARIKFHKLHVWENEETKAKCKELWNVVGVPNFKFFSNGTIVHEKVGGGTLETMKSAVHQAIDETFKQFGEKL